MNNHECIGGILIGKNIFLLYLQCPSARFKPFLGNQINATISYFSCTYVLAFQGHCMLNSDTDKAFKNPIFLQECKSITIENFLNFKEWTALIG